ncbi:MAG: threonine/serine exporter family protein [Mycobacterium sp.]|nr:threonine/serine exporter family protein [Mycobacterium sp.]
MARRRSDAFAKTVPPPIAGPDHFDPDDVAAMLREIGAALVETSLPIQVVEYRLRDIAARYTTQPVEVAVLPTLLFIQIGTAVHQMESSVQPSGLMDVAARIDQIAELAGAGAISPLEAVAEVHAARTAPPRFGAVVTTLGYALTTVGFGMAVQPSWRAMLAHLFLGLVVGLIVAIARPFPDLAPILPTLAALVVTLLGTWFVADVAHDGLLRVIAPGLIATLPGMALVVGSIELASGKIISGASRLAYGIAQLGLLVYGMVLGVRIAGQVIPSQGPSSPMGWWSAYAAVVVIAVGLSLYLSAPRGSLPWLVLVIGVSMLAQSLAGLVLNAAHSGFIAAMVAIPFAVLCARIRTAPPASVLVLAAFWSLVPGQLTFMSLGRGAAGDYAGTAGLSVAAAAITSIALGTLVGWSLVRTLSR